jgi:hypothetical protein
LGYRRAVARTQTIVQLNDELLTELDELRAATGGLRPAFHNQGSGTRGLRPGW